MPDKTIPDKLFDDAVKTQLYTEQYANGLAKKVQGLLTAAQDEIAGKIAKIDPTSPTMTKWKQGRLEKLNESISEIVDSTYKDISKLSKDELLELGKFQAANTVNKFNQAIKADIFNVTLIPDNVKAIVENTMIDGKIIGDWWKDAKESTKKKLSAAMAAGTQALQVGMVQGESIGELINRIRGTKTTPGIMSLTKREATALTRTSVLQVSNAVRQETFKANADVLDGIEFVATLDTRTTPLCRAMDGKRYDMEMNPIGHSTPYPGAPPLHWQCRTTIVAITKAWSELAGPKSPLNSEQKKSLDNISVGMRASMNGQIAGNMTYQDWLLSQPVELQKDILGPGRWKLWSENKLDMADLIDNTGRQLSLTELQAKLGDILASKQVAIEEQLKKLVLESKSVEEFSFKIKGDIQSSNLLLQKPSKFLNPNKLNIEVEDYKSKGIDKETVDFFKKKIQDGETILPVYVEEGNVKHIIDGNHRAAAYRDLGKLIPVVEVPYGKAMQALVDVKGDLFEWYKVNLPSLPKEVSFLLNQKGGVAKFYADVQQTASEQKQWKQILIEAKELKDMTQGLKAVEKERIADFISECYLDKEV
jgi:SPP1 gp7 family putative phage head morphogenesis protein